MHFRQPKFHYKPSVKQNSILVCCTELDFNYKINFYAFINKYQRLSDKAKD